MTGPRPDMVVVIMAGGIGTRFWPASTDRRPKQFLSLLGERSLLQLSADRVSGLVPADRTLVLTNRAFVPLVREQLPHLPAHNVIGEPLRRDTAAAVGLGAVLARHRFGNPVIVTLTADHLIEPVAELHRTLLSAARGAAASGALYTLGIAPSYPATAYGYLERGQRVHDDDGIEHFELERFVEKPDAATAASYLESGRFTWNSGMFVWTADAILAELGQHLPDLLEALHGAVVHDRTARWTQALADAFARIEPVSVDYGVMEKASKLRSVAASFAWSDVGGWLALTDHLPRDRHGNWHRGRTVAGEASGNLVFCEDPGETVMLAGVDDLIVVRAGDRTLVAHRDHAERVKVLVAKLEE
jgi:mannose-1-phosphate guanylyltransferase